MKTIRRFALSFDTFLGRVAGGAIGPKNKLVSLAWHAVADDSRTSDAVLNPDYRLTVDDIRTSIRFYLDRGYRAASLADLLNGLDPRSNHVMFTFDDGYANFRLALPVLEEYGVPALFSIATHFIETGDAFWWDAHHRHAVARGVTLRQRQAESWRFNCSSAEEIQRRLKDAFGADHLRPLGNIDRPLTIDELRELAKHPLVTLANHTVHHYSMVSCSPSVAECEILEAQRKLFDWTGVNCAAFVAPFGHMTEAAAAACKAAGIQAAFALGPGRQYLPMDLQSEARWLIPRHCVRSDVPLQQQLERSLLNWSPGLRWRQRQNPPGVFRKSRFDEVEEAPVAGLVHAGVGVS